MSFLLVSLPQLSRLLYFTPSVIGRVGNRELHSVHNISAASFSLFPCSVMGSLSAQILQELTPVNTLVWGPPWAVVWICAHLWKSIFSSSCSHFSFTSSVSYSFSSPFSCTFVVFLLFLKYVFSQVLPSQLRGLAVPCGGWIGAGWLSSTEQILSSHHKGHQPWTPLLPARWLLYPTQMSTQIPADRIELHTLRN